MYVVCLSFAGGNIMWNIRSKSDMKIYK